LVYSYIFYFYFFCGYSYKCHHTQDIAESPNCNSDSLAFRQAYLNKDELDLDKLYEGYDACADFIAVAFYKEMLVKYPDSKVILTERPADSWFKSVKNTIFITGPVLTRADPSHPRYEFGRLIDTLVLDGLLKHPETFDDEQLFIKKYLDHNAEVKRLVPPERLYVMQLGEGWEGICKFLGKEVPDVPYPHINDTASFQNYIEMERRKTASQEMNTLKDLSNV
jgi:hypothetical protein